MATNLDIVNGFKPVGYLNGSSWNDKTNVYLIPATDGTATFLGDLVKIAGSSDSARGCRTIAQAAAGASTDIHIGVVVGFLPVDGVAVGSENLYRKHRPASTAMYALVSDDPNVVYECQDDSVGGVLAAASVGLNADIIVAAGDTTTGQSGMELDTSTVATTATLPLKILGFSNRPDNVIASANAKVLVQINAHVGKSGVVGA